MLLEDLIAYCLGKPGATEETPFGPETLVFKVAGKLFALTSPDQFPLRVNLKCDPERALELRDQYEAILPGYHMNKRHWNTVVFDGSVPDSLLNELVDHSYDLVVKGLPRNLREKLPSS